MATRAERRRVKTTIAEDSIPAGKAEEAPRNGTKIASVASQEGETLLERSPKKKSCGSGYGGTLPIDLSERDRYCDNRITVHLYQK
jgi:hypothetical protein